MKQTHRYISFFLLIISSVILFSSVSVSADRSFDVYLKAEYFRWREFLNDEEVVEETGPLFGIGGSARWDINSLILAVKGEAFGGSVDYDGQTTGGGPSLPVESDTDYLGAKIGGEFGWKFPMGEKSALEAFIGPEIRFWNREIQGTTIGNIRVVDAVENWFIFYAPLGIRGTHTFDNQLSIFAGGGVKIPIYNRNEADLTELFGVKVTVEPGREISGFAEAGLIWKMLKVALFYDGLRFSQSDPESVTISRGILRVLQPESEADMFGIKIGMTF
jgi:hypothetical protein